MKKIPPLLFPFDGKEKKKVKVITEVDTSDFYHIRKAVMEGHPILDDFTDIRITLINNDDKTHPIYRVNIMLRKTKGRYVGDSFVVHKVSETEWLFEPALGEPQKRSKKFIPFSSNGETKPHNFDQPVLRKTIDDNVQEN